MIPVGLGVVTLTFFIMKMTPGDPVVAFLGDQATPETINALRVAWGLDRPLSEQYFGFIGGLFTGDLGTSQVYRLPIAALIGERLPPTLMLMLIAAIFAVAISLPIAAWAATSKSPAVGIVVRFFTATLLGIPTFFLGTLMLIFLALRLRLFPVGGYGNTFGEHVYSLILPGLAIGLHIVPLLVRSLVSSISESLESDYVAFGRSKGLKQSTVLREYALRNGSISGISILGIQVGNIAGGALVVENVFGIPGMGSMLLGAVLSRDFPVVQAATVVFGALVVLVYLLTDLGYGWLDPRARAK